MSRMMATACIIFENSSQYIEKHAFRNARCEITPCCRDAVYTPGLSNGTTKRRPGYGRSGSCPLDRSEPLAMPLSADRALDGSVNGAIPSPFGALPDRRQDKCLSKARALPARAFTRRQRPGMSCALILTPMGHRPEPRPRGISPWNPWSGNGVGRGRRSRAGRGALRHSTGLVALPPVGSLTPVPEQLWLRVAPLLMLNV